MGDPARGYQPGRGMALRTIFHDEGYGHRELIIYDGSTAVARVYLTGREATALGIDLVKSGTADLWK